MRDDENETPANATRPRDAVRIEDLSLPPIDMAEKAGEQIYVILRGAILDLRLPPQSPLSETEIGAKLGASRTPVREALLRLREEGLIHTLPNRGSRVSPMDRARIADAQFLREALEVANVRHLADKGCRAEDRDRIAQNLADQAQALAAQDHPRFHQLDDQFHQLLAQATGFARAATVLEREKLQLDRLRHLSLKADGHLSRLLAEHQAIFDAVLAQDGPTAAALMVQHCRSVLDVLETYSTRFADYFA